MTDRSNTHRPATPAAIDRISIDVTETVVSGKWTGIERVVRRLSAELQTRSRQDPSRRPLPRLVVAIGGRFHTLNEAGLDRLMRPVAAERKGNRRALTVTAGKLLSYMPPLLLLVRFIQKDIRVRSMLRAFADPRPAEFGADDVVLLLDVYWGGTSSIGAARRARQSGAAVVSTIYDLIPITHPHHMARSLTSVFAGKLMEALMTSDGAIAISRYSARELRRWLGPRLPDLPIGSFRLGNDIAAPAGVGGRRFERNYTMVGTIEPRKRHDLVLDAFERRWASGGDCRLTIVGKIGWAAPSTLARLATHSDAGRIRLIHDADDARLATILSQSDAVIMASTVEGFGLPIVEALALDIPVIASDIEIFREVGGDAVVPFDPESSASLVAAMETLEADPQRYRALAAAFEWPSWAAAAEDLLANLTALLNAPARTRTGVGDAPIKHPV